MRGVTLLDFKTSSLEAIMDRINSQQGMRQLPVDSTLGYAMVAVSSHTRVQGVLALTSLKSSHIK